MESISADVLSKTIALLVESFVKSTFNKAAKFVKDLSKEIDIDFGQAYIDYLQKSYEKHSKIKTLLYRQEPKDLYSFYVCAALRSERKIIDPTYVKNVLKHGKRLVITGTGGIGKSILFKHLFLNTVTTTDNIPLLIELRGLNGFDAREIDFLDFAYRSICNNGFSLEKEYFEYSLRAGKYVFLLDGYDEIRGSINERVTQSFLDFCSKYGDNYFIVSSRPQECFIGWEGFKEAVCLPLSGEEALLLINKLEYDVDIKRAFAEELEKSLFEEYESFASNPLLLTIMLLTYAGRASFPANLNDFYEQAFSTLFHAHDASKCGYRRDIASDLGYEDFKKIFSYFCFKSYFANEYEFAERQILSHLDRAKEKVNGVKGFDSLLFMKDLMQSVCMLCQEGLVYKFIHRSFQEFFAASYVTQLSDEMQTTLLIPWVKKGNNVTSMLMPMLMDLQSDRFAKNILLPLLDDFNTKYIELGSDVFSMVQNIYSNFDLIYLDDEERDVVGVGIKSRYLRDIVELASKYDKPVMQAPDDESYAIAYKKLKEVFEFDVKDERRTHSFQEAIKHNCVEELKTCIWWALQGVEHTVVLSEKIRSRVITLKTKFEAVLEDL